jgi:restriction system protein
VSKPFAELSDEEHLELFGFRGEQELRTCLAEVHQWDEQKVRAMLRRLLLHSCSLGCDQYHLEFLAKGFISKEGPYSEYSRRVITYFVDVVTHKEDVRCLPWEGITWILDLLPDSPHQALGTLRSYMYAHAQVLPDGRYSALSHAAALIRARYIGLPENADDRLILILERHPRDLEVLVAQLYLRMGYEITLTPEIKDGGRDVLATRETPGLREHLRIECKRSLKNVAVRTARELLGVVADEKVTKGIIITTSDFTRDAKAFAAKNPRLELIDGRRFIVLLNEHLGYNWVAHLDRLCTPSQIKGSIA